LTLILFAVIFRYKPHLVPRVRVPAFVADRFPRLSNYTPLSTFADQRDAGLSSAAFDLEANVADDARVGLDEAGVQEVMAIMRRERVK
jgi:hypothetical protein